MIGDIEQSTLLSAVIPVLNRVLELQGQRTFSDLIKANWDASRYIEYLINKIWGVDFVVDSQNGAFLYDEKQLKKADINSYEGESFQGFYVFLIECDGYDWLLCQENGVVNVYDVKIPSNKFYLMIKQVLDWIRESTVLTLRKYEGQ